MAFLAGSIKVRTPFDSCKKPCTSSTLFNSILKRPIRAETNQNIPQKLWRRVEKSGFWRLIILQLLSLDDSGTRGRLRLWDSSRKYFVPLQVKKCLDRIRFLGSIWLIRRRNYDALQSIADLTPNIGCFFRVEEGKMIDKIVSYITLRL